MKVEELRELLKENESVKLRCFDEYYKDIFSQIEVLFIGDEKMFILDRDNHEESMYIFNLKHYELDTPKPEDEKWYQITAYKKIMKRPIMHKYLYKTKEEFLSGKNESDYHWIKLEEVKLGVDE